MDKCSLLIPGIVGKFIRGQDKGGKKKKENLPEKLSSVRKLNIICV